MSVAEAVRDHVAGSPEGSFIASRDLLGDAEARGAVDVALSRAVAAGELLRVARGLYWKGEATRFGMTRPDAIAAGLAAAEKIHGLSSGVGPTGASAAAYLGLTTQVPSVAEIAAATAIADTPEVRFHRRNGGARTGLRPAEVALLEVLRDFPRHTEAGWPAVVRRVRQLVREKLVDLDAVVRAARAERRPGARRLAEELSSAVAA